jgi:ATP-dependent DNA helicase RecG
MLVATTVIEVGVNVPEATIMVIEHAERFGLAQLHQLRGRIGRGTGASTCILLYAEPLTETAKARLSILRETEDGFRIAEEDLRLRGAGELLGTRQSGMPEFHLADLAAHADLLSIARDDARMILERDPNLASERGRNLVTLLYLFERDAAVKLLRSG